MEPLQQKIETLDNIIIATGIIAVVLVVICAILIYKTNKIKLPK
jgi:hypothetical protein